MPKKAARESLLKERGTQKPPISFSRFKFKSERNSVRRSTTADILEECQPLYVKTVVNNKDTFYLNETLGLLPEYIPKVPKPLGRRHYPMKK